VNTILQYEIGDTFVALSKCYTLPMNIFLVKALQIVGTIAFLIVLGFVALVISAPSETLVTYEADLPEGVKRLENDLRDPNPPTEDGQDIETNPPAGGEPEPDLPTGTDVIVSPPSNPIVEEVPEEVVEEVPPVEEVVSTPLEIILPTPTSSFIGVNEQTRPAIVNILCTTGAGGFLNPITGSGVVIDPRGVILTNTHIAQFLLLKDYIREDYVNCVIRGGSPARHLYKATVLYISSEWINKNRTAVRLDNPKGTGEFDYAFLLITDTTNPNTSLPSSFPFIPIDIRSSIYDVGDNVLVVGYPAGFLGGTTITTNLFITSSFGKVMEIFTFENNSPDLVAVSESLAAQKGASGGAIVGPDATLRAIIVTATDGETTSARVLNGITGHYINRSLIEVEGLDIQELLSGDLSAKATIFNETIAPTLTNILIDELNK